MSSTSPIDRALVWQWGRFGSGPRYAFELSRALREHCGYDTTLSLAEGSELMQSLKQKIDLPIHTYSSGAEFLFRTLGMRSVLTPLLEQLRRDPPRVAVLTMVGYWDIFFVRQLHDMGIPVVFMVHDAEVHPGDRFHAAVHLQRRLLRMSDGVITLTDFVARKVMSRTSLAGKALVTIPHPAFDFADLALPSPKLPNAVAEGPLRLLLAGRLKRYKGLQLLADALKSVLSDAKVAVRVVGAARDQKEIASLASVPGVEFDLGWKSERDLFAYIDSADAVVLPYIEASQSGIAPMSFKRGRPVIATAVGGLPEQIRDGVTGLLAEAGSAESLAAAINRLAQDRVLLRRLGENALHHAETYISWRSLAPRFGKFLERITLVQSQH